MEGFRAYKKAVTFDCAADAVVLVGPNGYGKTSFFDAVSWALFGHIRRLTGSRDAVGEEYIRNRFASSEDVVVRLFIEHDGESALVNRTRNSFTVVANGGELDAPAAARWVAALFSRMRGSRHDLTISEAERIYERCFLLAQEELTAFVRESSPRERFDIIARLLGVDLVRDFYAHESSHLETLEQDAGEVASELRVLDQRLERIRLDRKRLESAGRGQPRPSLARLRKELAAILRAHPAELGSIGDRSTGRMSADDIAETTELTLTNVVGSLEGLSQDMAALSELATLLPGFARLRTRMQRLTDQVAAAEAQLEQTQDRLESARKRVASLQAELKELRVREADVRNTEEEFADFLAQARQHVSGNRCPVCGQAIIASRVVNRLQERIDQGPKEIADLAESKRLLSIRIARHRTTLANREEDANRLQEEVDRHRTELDTVGGQVRRIEELAEASALEDSTLGSPDSVANALSQAKRSRTRLRALQRELSGLMAQAEFLAARTQLNDLKREQQDSNRERRELVQRGRQLARLHRSIQQVVRVSKRAEVDLVRELLSRQQPLMNALYRRLNPHPILDRLDVDFKHFADRGELYFYAASEKARGNINTIFSSAQLNAVATCLFLSLNLSHSGDRPAIALLDDPIQNMDDYNVVGLLDMLRAFLPLRQLVVSTHDAAIGQLIARKLRPLESGGRTIVHTFSGYETDGPRVHTDVMEHQEEPWVIRRLAS